MENVLLLTQVALYIVSFLLSFCLIVPVAYHLNDFRGHCLLFSTGEWREEDGQFQVTWASSGFCIYSIFVGCVFTFVSVIQITRCVIFLCKKTDSSFLSAFIDVIASITVTLLGTADSLMVTLGFHTWCTNIMKRFEACQDATENDIDRADNIDTSNFFVQIGTAQFGVWSLWACWVALSVCAIAKLCRYHQEENLRLSMYQRRQKMLNEQAASSIEEEPTDDTVAIIGEENG